MGKAKYILYFICFCFISKGQITFPAAGADWHYSVATYTSPSAAATYSYTEVKYIKDTLFMGKTVQVLSTPYYYSSIAFWTGGNTYVYTSNDSVFFYNSQTLNQWQLLYSFNTPIGQSWQILYKDYDWVNGTGTDTITVKVDSVKNTLINSKLLKTLYVTYTEIYHAIGHQYSYPSVIYDRIGDTNYVFNFISGISLNAMPSSEIKGLLCYTDSTMTTYQVSANLPCNLGAGINKLTEDVELYIYPNPAQNILHLKTTFEKIYNYKIVNALGEFVLKGDCQHDINTGALQNGIYFLCLYEQNKLVYTTKFLKE